MTDDRPKIGDLVVIGRRRHPSGVTVKKHTVTSDHELGYAMARAWKSRGYSVLEIVLEAKHLGKETAA